MSKSLLILGGSHSEIPLIEAAKEFKLKVFTTGNRSEQIGHQLSDEYIPGDFSDFDEMLYVIKKSKCDYICSGANDYSYLSACNAAEKMNLPGYDPLDTAYALHHKHLFKPIAKQLGIPTTNFCIVDIYEKSKNKIKYLNFPLIIKPVDLTGGKGISKITRIEELESALEVIKILSKEKFAIVEEFFEGSLHSYSTLIINEQVVFQYADNEFCLQNPYLVSSSCSLASVPLDIIQDIKSQVEKIAKFLKLKNGILHCQFIYSSGDYKILEFTRRCSGDFYSSVVEAVTGLKHSQQFIRSYVNLELSLQKKPTKSQFISRHCIFSENKGLFMNIRVDKSLEKNVILKSDAFKAGFKIDHENKEKMGVVILEFKSQIEMLRNMNVLESLVTCNVS
jgi:biotin carboxylase